MHAGLPWRKALFTVTGTTGAQQRKMGKNRSHMVLRTGLFMAGLLLAAAAGAVLTAGEAQQRPVPVLYPKDHSTVGSRVNLVLDPATDWATVPFFQVVVNKREYPVVDTSGGRHAFQGLQLEPELNTLFVKVLAPADKKKESFTVVGVREITVFNKEGIFTPVPRDFRPELFHTREQEAECSGCHRLEVEPKDIKHAKPEDVLCQTCHKSIPSGEHIHGPAAVWNCLACHNHELYPVKYQFSSHDPWKAVKTIQAVEPQVFTIPSASLYKPASASFLIPKNKIKELFLDALTHIKQNPRDKVRIEAHTDNQPLAKKAAFKTRQALSDAQAKAVAALLKSYGVPVKLTTAVGMADKLPKAPNITKEGRELNSRIEIVVYPPDVKLKNSMNFPVLTDRERVVVNLSYSKGPAVRNLRVVDRLSKGRRYQKGSGLFRGKGREPKVKDDEFTWELGDIGADFQETLSFVVKKGKKASPLSPEVKVVYLSGRNDVSRFFDPKSMERRGSTVAEACFRCHDGILSGAFKHGPADAGYCNLCHDPHASPYPAWLRKESWDLCVTCHAEKASGRHVVAGYSIGTSHPTKDRRDVSRPGKRMSCASCHEPHSAETRDLFAFKAKTRFELCNYCHAKK